MGVFEDDHFIVIGSLKLVTTESIRVQGVLFIIATTFVTLKVHRILVQVFRSQIIILYIVLSQDIFVKGSRIHYLRAVLLIYLRLFLA